MVGRPDWPSQWWRVESASTAERGLVQSAIHIIRNTHQLEYGQRCVGERDAMFRRGLHPRRRNAPLARLEVDLVPGRAACRLSSAAAASLDHSGACGKASRCALVHARPLGLDWLVVLRRQVRALSV